MAEARQFLPTAVGAAAPMLTPTLRLGADHVAEISRTLTGEPDQVVQLTPDTDRGRQVLGVARSILSGKDLERLVALESRAFAARVRAGSRVFHEGGLVPVVHVPSEWLDHHGVTSSKRVREGRAAIVFLLAATANAFRETTLDLQCVGIERLRPHAVEVLERAGYSEPPPEAIEGVAAALLALSEFPPRSITYDVVQRFFDVCLVGRPDVSIIEAAVLESLGGAGKLPLFSEEVERLIFEVSDMPEAGTNGPVRSVAEVPPRELLSRYGVDPRSDAFFRAARIILEDDMSISSTISGVKLSETKDDPVNAPLEGLGSLLYGSQSNEAERRYLEAVDYVIEVSRSGRQPVFEDFLRIQDIVLGKSSLLKEDSGEAAGKLREEFIVLGDASVDELRAYPEVWQVKLLMPAYRDWFDAELRKVEQGYETPENLAARVYRRAVSIHPSPNGNGRIWRLSAALCLLCSGLPPPVLATDAEKKPAVFASLKHNLNDAEYAALFSGAVARGARLAGVVAGNNPVLAFEESDPELLGRIPMPVT